MAPDRREGSMERDDQRLRDGFRHRGRDITRLEVFVDAAFAFAVTLLVISIDTIPDSIDALVQVLKGVPAFGVSLAMIALFWSAHARWSRRFGLDDGSTTVLSIALVFLVLVYVYPLKMMFASFFGWISGGWLPHQLRITGYADILTMFVIYGIAFVTLSLCLLGLYLHAWRRRRDLGLDAFERQATGGEIATYLYFALVGLLSVALALAMPARPPNWLASGPGLVYFLMFFTGLAERAGRRAAARVEGRLP
jgi:uncharacterized membrane protein